MERVTLRHVVHWCLLINDIYENMLKVHGQTVGILLPIQVEVSYLFVEWIVTAMIGIHSKLSSQF